MIKTEIFDTKKRHLSELAKTMAHPARLAILEYLAQCKTCISGDISNEIPLSRTTVSQHLKELKKAGLIQGEIEGLKIHYCLNTDNIKQIKELFDNFFEQLISQEKLKC
jgi:DNA-binding transcriptional ArsR family regulator